MTNVYFEIKAIDMGFGTSLMIRTDTDNATPIELLPSGVYVHGRRIVVSDAVYDTINVVSTDIATIDFTNVTVNNAVNIRVERQNSVSTRIKFACSEINSVNISGSIIFKLSVFDSKVLNVCILQSTVHIAEFKKCTLDKLRVSSSYAAEFELLSTSTTLVKLYGSVFKSFVLSKTNPQFDLSDVQFGSFAIKND